MDQAAINPQLQQYAQTRSPAAFEAIVDRYVNLVYASALRHVSERELAADITQTVFSLLAQKADRVSPDRPLSAWLLATTRYVALNERRQRARRRKLEQRVAAMNHESRRTLQDQPDWNALGPLVDEGLSRLRAGDRDVLMLRYFECQSLRGVAAAMGISEEAAGKRVQRALERLRTFFRRRGITAADVTPALTALSTTDLAPAALRQSLAARAGKSATSAVGGGVALSAKLAGATAAVMVAALAISIVISTRPSNTATTAVTTTMPSAWSNLADEKTLRAVKQECFPKEVCDALLASRNQLNGALVAIQGTTIMSQAYAIDSKGVRWLAVVDTAWGNPQGTVEPGNTGNNDLSGIFMESGALLPVQRVRTDRNTLRVSAKSTDPWPVGEPRTYYWLMREPKVTPARDGTYPMWISNAPGRNCMQQLALVLSPRWRMRSNSEPPILTQKAGDYQIHFWHRQVSQTGEHRVDLVLERTGG